MVQFFNDRKALKYRNKSWFKGSKEKQESSLKNFEARIVDIYSSNVSVFFTLVEREEVETLDMVNQNLLAHEKELW